jgi:tRNA A37 methylthiotransferase MiaB
LFQDPDFILNVCEKYYIQNTKKPILLSIPSFFALDWAQQFSGLIKNRYPEKKIIVGGRWVVGNNTELIKSYMGVDLVVPGLVGKNILNIVETLANQKTKHETVSNILKDSESIEYKHLYERDLFQPSIIASTGCGMGCSFCEEKNIKLSKLKSTKVVADEMCSR